MAKDSPSNARGPVVVVFVDGWAGPDGEPTGSGDTPELTSLVAGSPWTTLAAAGEAVGLASEHPPSEHAAYRAAGTGAKAKLPSTRVEEALADLAIGRAPAIGQLVSIALSRRGKVEDFVTQIVRDACSVHLFALISDASSHGDVRHLEAVLDLLLFHELPILVHAILDGVDMPEKSAWSLIERIESRFDGRGRIATITGRSFAMDAYGDWEKTLEVYRTVVHAEGDRYHDANQALSSSYAAGYADANIPPVLVGDYNGVQGGLILEVPSERPAWEWRGEDVAVFVGLRSEDYRQLAAVLTRTNLPPDVAERVTVRGRAVYAFNEECVATFVPINGAPAVATIFPDEPPAWSLGAFFASRGQTQLRIASPGREDHVELHFDGGAAALAEAKTSHAASDAAALARAKESVSDGSASFVVVGLGGIDRAARAGDGAGAHRALVEIDGALGDLARAVRERDGLLVITASHGPPKPRSTEADRVPLVLVSSGASGAPLRKDGTLADLAPTIVAWLGAEVPAEVAGRSLLAPIPK